MRAIALYQCIGEDSNELSFQVGQLILDGNPDEVFYF